MDIEQRLNQLERRLLAAEDQLEIIRLLNSYGPLVDSGEGAAAASLWVDNGRYNFSGKAESRSGRIVDTTYCLPDWAD